MAFNPTPKINATNLFSLGQTLSSIRVPGNRQGFRRQYDFNNPDQYDQRAHILLNVVRSETHTISNELTRAPIENTADSARHIIPQPIRLSIDAIVSAGSDSYFDSLQAVYIGGPFRNTERDADDPTGNGFNRLEQAASVVPMGPIVPDPTGQLPQPFARAKEARRTFWARIQALNDERTPFEYISDLQVYQEMVFVSIEVVRDEREWIEFTAELEQFIYDRTAQDRWITEEQLDLSRKRGNAGLRSTQPVADSTQIIPSLTSTDFVSSIGGL